MKTDRVPGIQEQSESPGDADTVETRLLLEFLRGRNYSCPRCDYNLCNLPAPVCPECGEALKLTVGRRSVRYGMLILTMAPGIFSGIMASIMLSVGLYSLMFRSWGTPPIEAVVTVTFGFLSGTASMLLFRYRPAYLNADRSTQLFWTLLVWLIHLVAFVVFVQTI